jgi:hypothetical protein
MKTLNRIVVGGLFALILGCAQLGLQPAQTVPQKIAYAYGVHTAVLTAAASSLAAKTIDVPTAKEVATLADQSRALLDSAKAIADSGGDLTAASSKLALATAILTQLQTYLQGSK